MYDFEAVVSERFLERGAKITRLVDEVGVYAPLTQAAYVIPDIPETTMLLRYRESLDVHELV